MNRTATFTRRPGLPPLMTQSAQEPPTHGFADHHELSFGGFDVSPGASVMFGAAGNVMMGASPAPHKPLSPNLSSSMAFPQQGHYAGYDAAGSSLMMHDALSPGAATDANNSNDDDGLNAGDDTTNRLGAANSSAPPTAPPPPFSAAREAHQRDEWRQHQHLLQCQAAARQLNMVAVLRRVPLYYQIVSALGVVLVMTLVPQNSFVGVLLGALHVTFGMEALWPAVYREHLANITLHERLAFAGYAVLLGAIAVGIWRVFTSSRFTWNAPSIQQLVRAGDASSALIHLVLFVPALAEAAFAVRGNMEDVFTDMGAAVAAAAAAAAAAPPTSQSAPGALAAAASAALSAGGGGGGVAGAAAGASPSAIGGVPNQWLGSVLDADQSHWRLQAAAMLWTIDYWKQVVVIPAVCACLWRLVSDVIRMRYASQRWSLVTFCAWRCIVAFVVFPQRFFSWVGTASLVWSLFAVGVANYCSGASTITTSEFVAAGSVRESVYLTVSATIRSAVVIPFLCVAVLTVLAGVHVIELLGLWLCVFLLFIWTPVSIRCFSTDAIALQCLAMAAAMLLWVDELAAAGKQPQLALPASERVYATMAVAFALFSVLIAVSAWVVILLSLPWRDALGCARSPKFVVPLIVGVCAVAYATVDRDAALAVWSPLRWHSAPLWNGTANATAATATTPPLSSPEDASTAAVAAETRSVANNATAFLTPLLLGRDSAVSALVYHPANSKLVQATLVWILADSSKVATSPSLPAAAAAAAATGGAATAAVAGAVEGSGISSTTAAAAGGGGGGGGGETRFLSTRWLVTLTGLLLFVWAIIVARWLIVLRMLQRDQQQAAGGERKAQDDTSATATGTPQPAAADAGGFATPQHQTAQRQQSVADGTAPADVSSTQQQQQQQQQGGARRRIVSFADSWLGRDGVLASAVACDATINVLSFSIVVDRIARSACLVTLCALSYGVGEWCGRYTVAAAAGGGAGAGAAGAAAGGGSGNGAFGGGGSGGGGGVPTDAVGAGGGPLRWATHFVVSAFALGVAMDVVDPVARVLARCMGSASPSNLGAVAVAAQQHGGARPGMGGHRAAPVAVGSGFRMR